MGSSLAAPLGDKVLQLPGKGQKCGNVVPKPPAILPPTKEAGGSRGGPHGVCRCPKGTGRLVEVSTPPRGCTLSWGSQGRLLTPSHLSPRPAGAGALVQAPSALFPNSCDFSLPIGAGGRAWLGIAGLGLLGGSGHGSWTHEPFPGCTWPAGKERRFHGSSLSPGSGRRGRRGPQEPS